jgi:hypothetical protein
MTWLLVLFSLFPLLGLSGQSSNQGVLLGNGDFETGNLTGFTASGINGGGATVVREGTCFSFFNTRGLIFNGDFVARVRSSGPAPINSIGILTSDPFVASNFITFRALSENSDLQPVPDPVTLEVRLLDLADNILLSQVIKTNIVTLDDPGSCSGEPRNGAFSTHFIDTSPFGGLTVKLQFRQHTNVPGAGFFTLVDDIRSGCGVSALNGTYVSLEDGGAFAERGPRVPSGGASTPVVVLNTLNLDGNGVITGGVGSTNVGSNVRRNFSIVSGNYDVSTECAGSLTYTLDFGATVTQDFVIADDGEEYRFVSTNPRRVQSGSAKKQVTSSCDESVLSGTFGLLFRGDFHPNPRNAFRPAQPSSAGFFPVAFALNLDFDGGGTITGGVGSANVGTQVTRGALVSGNYNVGSNCTGDMTLTLDSGISLTLDFTIVDEDEFRFIGTSNFSVVIGDGKRQ